MLKYLWLFIVFYRKFSLAVKINNKLIVNKADIYAQYDFDDNLFFMPTKIVFFAKDKNALIKEIEVSTNTFAKTRNKIGIENYPLTVNQVAGIFREAQTGTVIDLLDYEVVAKDDASFRQFRDDENEYFINDLKSAVAHQQFGPSFKDFQEHCSHVASAKNIKIITARGQSPETIYQGLINLQNQGLIHCVPRLANIIPVSYSKLEPKEFRATETSPQEAKMRVLAKVLDEIEQRPHLVSSSFGFSDDDTKTFDFTKNYLVTEIKKGRWSKTQINLYFTGAGHKKQRYILCNPVKNKV